MKTSSQALVHLDDAVYNRSVMTIDAEDHNLSSPEGLLPHVQEQDVPTVKPWLHAATQHHYHLPALRRSKYWELHAVLPLVCF
jgi:hypothetical protein